MRRRTLLAALAALPPLARPALGQGWPARPVRVVVPYPAGQGTDIFGRRFAEFYARHFGQPFVVENRAGASGSVGAAFVARAEPDGYTLLWGTNATHTANEFMYASIGYDPVRDFEPIAGILRLGMVAVVRPQATQQDLAGFVRAGKAQPGRIAVGVPSTTARAVAEMLRRATGLELADVPYSGSGQALTGVLRGDVQLGVDTLAAMLGAIRGGQLKALGVSLGKRSESLPDLPTFREQGVDVEVDAWNACFAPRGTPREIVLALNAASNAALADRALRAAVVDAGAEPMGGTPEDLAQLIRADRAKWEPVIRGLGITAQ
jgi:tripartite-type tricarboxylate transporter receptor subunit TctC